MPSCDMKHIVIFATFIIALILICIYNHKLLDESFQLYVKAANRNVQVIDQPKYKIHNIPFGHNVDDYIEIQYKHFLGFDIGTQEISNCWLQSADNLSEYAS